MPDYRELFGVSDISKDTQDGVGVKIAILDTGIPRIKDILVYLSDNFTPYSGKDTGHASFIGSLIFGHDPVIGICNQATACFLKVFEGIFSSPDVLARAIRHAVDTWKVDVINLSLGFSRSNPCPKQLKEACEYAYKQGVTLVAASGNDGGETLWPAALPEVISVGSTNGVDRESFSNYGKVDFVVSGRDLEGYDENGTVVKKTGTSFSTAIVSGMAALVIAKLRKEGKVASPKQVKKALASTCKDLNEQGYDKQTGYGLPFSIQKGQNKTPWLMIKTIYDKIMRLLKKALD